MQRTPEMVTTGEGGTSSEYILNLNVIAGLRQSVSKMEKDVAAILSKWGLKEFIPKFIGNLHS